MGFFASSGILNQKGFFSAISAVAAPAFSPTDLSGLSLWLKADAGITLSGSDVTAWADQSGNGKNMTSDISPTFVSNAKNGKPAIAFSGNRMTGLGIFTGSESRTFFVVYYTDNADSDSNTICGQNNLLASDAGTFFMMQARNDFLDSSPYLAGYSADLSGPAYVNNVWNIATADYDGTIANLYANGSLVNSGELALDTYNSGNCFTIGCFYDPIESSYLELFAGKLCEIIAYNRVLNGTERGQVNTYLNTKYAIY
jgi:hypothetical protein